MTVMTDDPAGSERLPTGGADLDLALRALSDDEIVALKLDLQEDLGEIKEQLRQARVRAATTGSYSDSDWYSRANGAHRVKANQYNAACVEQGRRRRERHAAKSQEVGRIDDSESRHKLPGPGWVYMAVSDIYGAEAVQKVFERAIEIRAMSTAENRDASERDAER